MQHASPYNLPTGNAARDLVHKSGFLTVVFLLAHIPLALLMRQSSLLATGHALFVLAIGVVFALSNRSLERVAALCAYIVGAEVLWRMSRVSLFWEYGKYALVLIVVLALFRRRSLGGSVLPLVYFLLLLPSAVLTITQLSTNAARMQISSNLSGPLALFICAWFGAQLYLNPTAIRQILISLVGPVLGIASIAVFGLATAETISFTGESNFATSGGFGPNQVSAMLGLGVIGCLWYVLDPGSTRGLKSFMLLAALVLTIQSLLTFSRTGIYLAAGSFAVAVLFLVRDGRVRARLFFVLVLIGLIGYYLILPGLDTFTGGTLSQRYQDTSMTNREELMQGDLRVWANHPLAGVGPGMGRFYRASSITGNEIAVAPHTEFSRLLAEHGSLGLLALLALLLMAWRNLARQREIRPRAFIAMLLAWTLLFMVVSGMRLAAPGYLFGLTFAMLIDQDMV